MGMVVNAFLAAAAITHPLVGYRRFQAVGSGVGGTHNVSLLPADLYGFDGVLGDGLIQQDDWVVITYAIGNSPAADLAVAAPSGYSVWGDAACGLSSCTNIFIWAKKMGAVPDTNVLLPTSAAGFDIACNIFVLRGIHGTTPLDGVTPTYEQALGTNPDPAAITPSTVGAWILVCSSSSVRQITFVANPVPTDPANWWYLQTTQDTDNASAGSACCMAILQTAWAAGSYNPAAYTGGNVHASGTHQSYTFALRPV